MKRITQFVQKIKAFMSDTSKTYADSPRKFALKDWKNAVTAAKDAITTKDLGVLAAGVAYFLTFAVFPAIAASVAILGFAISPAQLTATMQSLKSFLPNDIALLISSQLEAALSNPSSGIIVVAIGLLVALFGLSGAMSNVIKATNAAYDVQERRKFVKLRLLSAGLIVFTGSIIAVTAGLLLLNEAFLTGVGVPSWLAWVVIVVRWVVIAALVAIGLSVFYRYGPNRENPKWQWVTWGSVIATIVWLLGTTLFFVYARYFATYTESYGVFAGIIVLMVWLNLTAFAVLLGAAINHGLESQTRVKTKRKK